MTNSILIKISIFSICILLSCSSDDEDNNEGLIAGNWQITSRVFHANVGGYEDCCISNLDYFDLDDTVTIEFLADGTYSSTTKHETEEYKYDGFWYYRDGKIYMSIYERMLNRNEHFKILHISESIMELEYYSDIIYAGVGVVINAKPTRLQLTKLNE